LKRYLAFLLLGFVIGLIFMNTFLNARLDQLYIAREKLKVELYDNTERLKKLEAQWHSHQTIVIHEVDIQFSDPVADRFLEVELRETILMLTQGLIGEEVEKIPYTLVVHLLDQRIVEAGGERYRLSVQTVILAEKLTYVLRCAPVTELHEDEP
jgi:Fe-S cluster biosynthesis and repair protein YggX